MPLKALVALLKARIVGMIAHLAELTGASKSCAWRGAVHDLVVLPVVRHVQGGL